VAGDRFSGVVLAQRSGAGDRFSYSGPGYVLLAWIVEQVSGQAYASFLAERIFGPLGLRSAAAVNPSSGPGYRAFNAWLPDDDIRVALCGNDEAADISHLLTQALREALAR
jgi:CubicO group peptidase (beta-lactamase class C family)